MPELPEVQTVVSDLNKKIIGHRIVGFWTDTPKAIKGQSAEFFGQAIKGKKILKAHRIGKNMFIDLSDGLSIYIHLKMTGHLLVKSSGKGSRTKDPDYFSDKVNQYIRHSWQLDKGVSLEFSDLRKFAKIVLLKTSKIRQYKDLSRLGVDALEAGFTLQRFREIVRLKGNLPIGILLLDQNLIAGIGNIYRSEILFEAGVSPFRKAQSLTPEEVAKIFRMTKQVLKKAVRMRGTSDSDYRDTDGAPGNFHKVLKVYNREKQLCRKKGCRDMIQRKKLSQRSVFFCASCQK